jgi:hypothetical protein
MPLYSYKCADGHAFDRHGKIDGSDFPARCPIQIDAESVNCRCDAAVEKVLAVTARAFPGADSWRSKNGA